MGASLEPVISYTDENCMKCGSCLQGCPTNAGKSTQNTYISVPWARGELELRAECHVDRVLVEEGGDGLEARGVEYTDADGARHTVERGRGRRRRRRAEHAADPPALRRARTR